MAPRESYVHRVRSGTVFSVLVLLLVFPVLGIGAFLEDRYGSIPTTVGLLSVLALAAAFYLFYVTEVTLSLDGDTVRHTQQDIAFGMRRALRPQWEFPRGALTSVREITTRTPSSRGGWAQSAMLHFPGEHKISDLALGSKSDPQSAYSRLAQSLRTQLGERFTSEDKV